MIKRLLPTIIAVATLVSAAYMLTLVDQLVQGTLPSYGLVFSYDWANPYWTLLRTTWALLAVCIAAITANTIIIVRSKPKEKDQDRRWIPPTQETTADMPTITQTKERIPTMSHASSPQPQAKPLTKPASITPTESLHGSSEATPLFKCTHCGKTFTQPLRMLNFQVDPPRIVNVCPFCNETMPSGSTVKESEQAEDGTLLRERDDRAQTYLTR